VLERCLADDLRAQQLKARELQVLGKRLRLQCFAGSLRPDAPALEPEGGLFALASKMIEARAFCICGRRLPRHTRRRTHGVPVLPNV
jgi:hypothetical protein